MGYGVGRDPPIFEKAKVATAATELVCCLLGPDAWRYAVAALGWMTYCMTVLPSFVGDASARLRDGSALP